MPKCWGFAVGTPCLALAPTLFTVTTWSPLPAVPSRWSERVERASA